MRTMACLALAVMLGGVAEAQLSDDYIASKIRELGQASQVYNPDDRLARGVDDCSDGEVYDDGGFDGSAAITTDHAGFVQLFTPQQLPFQYDTFCVCLIRNSSGSNVVSDAHIVFYDDDGPDGGPGTLLGSVTRTITDIQDTNPCNFFEVGLGTEAPLISTERVYIGMLFNREIYEGVSFGYDDTESTPDRAFYYTGNGVNFTPKADGIFADKRAMMMRAEGVPVCNEEVLGLLDPFSNSWDRIFLNDDPSLTCEAVPTDSGNDNMAYEVIPISSPTGGLFTAEINSNGSLPDTMMALYCDPFDPLNPTANLIAYDDDDGPGFYSAFVATDGLFLEPNTTYQVVVSTYSTAAYGNFSLCLGGTFSRERICTTTTEGNLGSASPHYDRIVSTANGALCDGLSADTVQDNMPYAAVPFELNTAGFLEVSVVGSGTSITNPVMTLYCDPFDPLAPGTNIVAYDDNDGEGMMPAFNLADQIDLSVGTKYWLVVSTWEGDDADGGDFELCFSSDVTVAYPLETCDDDSLFGNEPATVLDNWNGFSIGDENPSVYYEDFFGLSDPIVDVVRLYRTHHKSEPIRVQPRTKRLCR